MVLTEHQLRARIATEHSKRQPDPGRIAELREQHREALLTEWVQRQLAAGPPLSQATRNRLAVLFAGQRAGGPGKYTRRAGEAA